MNTVTGVFVELAMRANVNCRQVTINDELAAKKQFLRDLHNLFHEMDGNGDGCISYEEFCNSLADERVIAYFKALNLDVHDTRALFHLLDVDRSDRVDMVEFLNGCYQLQGDARSIDTKMIRMTLKHAVQHIDALRQTQEEQKAVLAQQANRLSVAIARSNLNSANLAARVSKGSKPNTFCNGQAGSGSGSTLASLSEDHAAFGNESTLNCLSHGNAGSKTGSTLTSCGNGTAKATVAETTMSYVDSRQKSMSRVHSEGTNAERTLVTAARPRQCTGMCDVMKRHHQGQVAFLGDAGDGHLHQFLAFDRGRGGSSPPA
jgi:hypothetical protein